MEKITREDLLQLKFVNDPAVSPDGRHTVYVEYSLNLKENSYEARLKLLNNETGAVLDLTNLGKESPAVWLDSGTLIFSTERGKGDEYYQVSFIEHAVKRGGSGKHEGYLYKLGGLKADTSYPYPVFRPQNALRRQEGENYQCKAEYCYRPPKRPDPRSASQKQRENDIYGDSRRKAYELLIHVLRRRGQSHGPSTPNDPRPKVLFTMYKMRDAAAAPPKPNAYTAGSEG